MWRYPCSDRLANASAAGTPGATESGFGVIQSDTCASAVSAPAAAIRIMSRSVRMPTGLSSCTTTTDPTRFSRMRPAASARVSSGVAVTTGVLMSSATVGALEPSVMSKVPSSVSLARSLRRAAATAALLTVAAGAGACDGDQMSYEEAGSP
jgi:hypothetical protein